jgi:undecaprenyl-diphosphatase
MKSREKIKLIMVFYAISALVFLLFGNEIIKLDEQIFLQINQIKSPVLDSFFLLITIGGSTFFWLLMVIVFFASKNKRTSILLAIAFFVDSMVLTGSKLLFNRLRPREVFSGIKLLDYETDPSFPSGHSERAFSGATILSSIYKNLKPLLYCLAALVAVSRVYLGAHFLIDIIYGSINGIFIGYLVRDLPVENLEAKLKKLF